MQSLAASQLTKALDPVESILGARGVNLISYSLSLSLSLSIYLYFIRHLGAQTRGRGPASTNTRCTPPAVPRAVMISLGRSSARTWTRSSVHSAAARDLSTMPCKPSLGKLNNSLLSWANGVDGSPTRCIFVTTSHTSVTTFSC